MNGEKLANIPWLYARFKKKTAVQITNQNYSKKVYIIKVKQGNFRERVILYLSTNKLEGYHKPKLTYVYL